jgi:hypothetical protein
VEVGAALGYSVPIRDQFARAVVVMDRGFPIWGHYEGRHQAAPVLSVRAAVWSDQRIGVELLSSVYGTFRTVSLSPPFWPQPARGRATVTTVAARLAVALARSDSREIQVSLGPLLTILDGAAYDNPPASSVALGQRAAWGGSAAIAMQYPLSRRLSVRAALDAAVYRVRLVAIPVEDTTSTPLQLDLAPSFGVVVRIP